MSDLISTGGAGGFGALLGALMSFFGIKSKINDVDKRIDRLADVVQYSSTCEAVQESMNKQFKAQKEMTTEIRDDIKHILREMRK